MALVRHSCALALSEILMYAHEPFGDIWRDAAYVRIPGPLLCVTRRDV